MADTQDIKKYSTITDATAFLGKNSSGMGFFTFDTMPLAMAGIADVDDIVAYAGSVRGVHSNYFTSSSTGTKPCTKGFMLTYVWSSGSTAESYIVHQLAIDSISNSIYSRVCNSGTWTDWHAITIS